MPWNVPTHMLLPGMPNNFSMRPRISCAALFVNVTARMECGDAPSVLDDPGDAMREHARLARTRAGEHEHRAHGRGDRVALRVVQRVENGGEVHGGRGL